MRIILSQASANENSLGQPSYNSNRYPKDAFEMNVGNYSVDEMVELMTESESLSR